MTNTAQPSGRPLGTASGVRKSPAEGQQVFYQLNNNFIVVNGAGNVQQQAAAGIAAAQNIHSGGASVANG